MRLPEFQKYLQIEAVDVALFFNDDSNLTYFSGVKADMACLAIPASGKPLLFVPGFEAERLARSATVDVVQVGKGFLKAVRDEFPGKKAGVVPSCISYADAKAVEAEWRKVVSVEEKCTELRLVKTREELARITKACAITDVLFVELCENMKSFRTELDAATFLKSRMSLLGFEPSFPPIVAAGRNGATPHHVPGHGKLSGFVVLDFGIVYKNYCSDITRTVFVGNPTAADKRVYENLLKIQKACIHKVSPEILFEDIDALARKMVGSSMIHRIGHSLGIDVHDVQPRPLMLREGNVVTIEPGTYHPNKFGIRIEDDILVTKKSPIILTRSSKELVVIR